MIGDSGLLFWATLHAHSLIKKHNVCLQEQRELKMSLDELKEVRVLYEQEQRKCVVFYPLFCKSNLFMHYKHRTHYTQELKTNI